ncbi:single-stranded-DNA-specific exonuclease RecJ, partial [bacterium]
FGGSNFLLESLVRRGIRTPQAAAAFLDYTKYIPQPPKALPGIVAAVARIQAAVAGHETIGVWGDFDVDGQTATAVLVDSLRQIGAKVLFHIPIRSQESHGIKVSALQTFITPDMKVVVTCDTGISANDAAAYLKSVGVDLIITDHHQLPETLPDAVSIINPQFMPEGHPLRDLAGVGAAYKLAEALLEKFGLADYSQTLHDLVALGSIADIAVLRGDTRYLVQSGLNRIRTAPRLFLSKMAEMLDLPLDRLNEEHIGFYIAPRMNAVGRLDDANPMVNLLLSNDATEVNITLNQMEALNASRRVLVSQVFEGCMAQLESNPALLEQPLIILSHPEWPAGVIGIAAGRLAELTHRPVILLSGDVNGILRGSARSVAGIDITAALTLNKDLLLTFGGHPMAAGLSLNGDLL